MRYFINEDIDDSKIVVGNKEYKVKDNFDVVDDVETSHKMLNHDLGNITEKWMSREEIIEELKKIPFTAKYKFDKYSDEQLARILQKTQHRLAAIAKKEKEAKELFNAWEDADDLNCPECGEHLNDNGRCPICDEHNQDHIDTKNEEHLDESVANMSDEEWDNIGNVLEAHQIELEHAAEEAWQYALNDSHARWSEDYHLDEYKDEIEDLFKIYIADAIRDILFDAGLDANIKDIADKDLIKELDIDLSTEMPDWLEEEAYDDYKAEKENAGFEESVQPTLEALEKHDELNPDLWEDNELKPNVKEKLEEIVDKFVENLAEDDIKISVDDIVLVGSNANYNYTEHSDIDTHIVANMDIYKEQEDLAIKLYDAYKRLFNNKYDPTIYGHEVELYVEPDKIRANSNGMYSLNTGWIKEPEQSIIPDIDEEKLNQLVAEFENKIEGADTIAKIDDIIDELYILRQESILKEGEYGIGNQCFKEIRNLGLLQKLKDKKVEAENQKMSLKEANETYLKSKWDERAQKVCDSYKSALCLDNIPLEEDLIDWAVSDCCIKYNECKNNVIEMLNEGRGK